MCIVVLFYLGRLLLGSFVGLICVNVVSVCCVSVLLCCLNVWLVVIVVWCSSRWFFL